MAKTAMIRARIDPTLKEEAESVLQELGLTVTQAITLFYRQLKIEQGLPFAVKVPNATTRKTFKDTDAGRNLSRFNNANELFKDLGLQ